MKHLSLYQLSDNYLHALNALTDPEMDIPVEAMTDTLQGLSGELEDKAINVAKYLRNMEVSVKAMKSAEEDMAKRRQSLESRFQWLRDYLKNNLEMTGITMIECPYFKLSIAKNPAALDIFDTQAIPGKYKHTETLTVEQIDKAAIKAVLASGAEVPGARLTNGTRLVIK